MIQDPVLSDPTAREAPEAFVDPSPGDSRPTNSASARTEKSVPQIEPVPIPAPAEKTVSRIEPVPIQQVVKLLGSVVAPATLVTSLMLYFGLMHAWFFYNYFGVDASLLGLTTQDYLMRSVDALFVPLILLGVGGFLASRILGNLHSRLVQSGHRVALAVADRGAGAFGAALFLFGLAGVLRVSALQRFHFAVAPLCFASGVMLIYYSLKLVRDTQPASTQQTGPKIGNVMEAVVAFLLIAMSMFWAAADYAIEVGTGRAIQQAAELATLPDAVVFSKQSLSLSIPGVEETACVNPEASYRYRYQGFAMLPPAEKVFVLLPKSWSPGSGVAVLLPKNDSVRMEFRRESVVSATPAAC